MAVVTRPWTDVAWLAAAHSWIGEQLAATGARPLGEIEQPHVRPWSTAMRLSTDRGELWFKANSPALAFEARAVRRLADHWPDLVTELVAVDLERGWMLAHDAGERLREVIAHEGHLGRWVEILPQYAELQLAAAEGADAFVAAGVPDHRCAVLPGAFERLVAETDELDRNERAALEERVEDVEAMCALVGHLGVPETIQHNDLHDGQVFVQQGRYRFLDWGDACVSHPFLTTSVACEGMLGGLDDASESPDARRFRDAYLEPFTPFASRHELEAAYAASLRLGWISRALVTRPLALELDSPHREELLSLVPTYLRRFASGVGRPLAR